jgi:adenylylsulfate kinase-like enzyme
MKNKIFSIWLIGPTASGKTTVAKLIYEKLKKTYPNLVIVDGDEVRDLYDNKLGYDIESRKKKYAKIY